MPWLLLFLSLSLVAWLDSGEQSRTPNASHMHANLRVFAVDPGRWSNLKSMCLQTKQRKSEKTCAEEQPGGGLNAAINTDIKFSSRDNGPGVRGGETFLSLSSTVLLFHVTSGTAVSFSYHMVAGLHPGMCHVPVAPPPSAASFTLCLIILTMTNVV